MRPMLTVGAFWCCLRLCRGLLKRPTAGLSTPFATRRSGWSTGAGRCPPTRATTPPSCATPGDARSEASGFWRTGVTLWWEERAYASVSHLRGLDGQRRGKDFAMAEVGLQFEPWNDVLLRIGVAAIPAAHGFKRKVNPTPGLSVRVPL